MSTKTPLSQGSAHPWRTALLAGMASYLDAGALITTGVVLVLYAPTLGISDAMIGTLSGILTLGFAVGAIVGGHLGDRYGRRRVFTFTLLLYCVGIAVLALAPTAPFLFPGVVLVGLAIGSDLPVSLALIAEDAPEGRKGQMVIFSSLLWGVGIGAATLLSVFLSPLGELGGRLLYLHLFVVAITVLILRRNVPESREWSSRSSRETAENGDDGRIKLSRIAGLFTPPLLVIVIATALYYSIWNIGANSYGQFTTFFFVSLAGDTVQTASFLSLVTLPLSTIASLLFMKVVDTRFRTLFFVVGTISNTLAFLAPLVLGFSTLSFTLMLAFFGIGAGLCGEGMYKVWTQELVPTLQRSTAQGVTLAIARVVAALVAFVTPVLATSMPSALFGVLVGCAVVSGIIGIAWIPRLRQPTID